MARMATEYPQDFWTPSAFKTCCRLNSYPQMRVCGHPFGSAGEVGEFPHLRLCPVRSNRSDPVLHQAGDLVGIAIHHQHVRVAADADSRKGQDFKSRFGHTHRG